VVVQPAGSPPRGARSPWTSLAPDASTRPPGVHLLTSIRRQQRADTFGISDSEESVHHREVAREELAVQHPALCMCPSCRIRIQLDALPMAGSGGVMQEMR
jgi:hypothetical protein